MEGGIPESRSQAALSQIFIEDNIERYIEAYYKNNFPFQEIYQWLTYAREYRDGEDQILFKNREIAFKIFVNDHCNLFHRYQFFQNLEAFKQKVLELAESKKPDMGDYFKKGLLARLDVGGYYKIKRGIGISTERTLLWKEFVLDIDLDDYDGIRTCCQGKSCCVKCWKLAQIGQQLIAETLDKDLNLKQILWVYSGQRGVHGWICDRRARIMDRSVRNSILGYLRLSKYKIDDKYLVLSKVRENFDPTTLKFANPLFE